jgi:geranylgeranyl diphosphate synthase, type I
MFHKIKNKIDKELLAFVRNLNSRYSLKAISPILYESIKDFVLRDGKRIRPILFITGYLGYSKKTARNLYESAIAIELLHDFLLVHDDIVDKSPTRRGKPSMHVMFQRYLDANKSEKIKFSGEDLSIVTGDIMYAMAIDTFLSIKEKHERKENALRHFIKAAAYTGAGEFIELLSGIKSLKDTTKADIYKIYDYKTAHYTFSAPLSIGAILAGANTNQVKTLTKYGIALGRAFQIKDDIIGIFGNEKKIGKSTLSDLQEAKKTLPLWHCYHNSNRNDKKTIEKILSKKQVTRSDLQIVKLLIQKTNTLAYTQAEIEKLNKHAQKLLALLSLKKPFKEALINYSRKIITV